MERCQDLDTLRRYVGAIHPEAATPTEVAHLRSLVFQLADVLDDIRQQIEAVLDV